MVRREFLKGAAACAAAASLLDSATTPAHANPLGLPIGCQTWPVRDQIAKDFPGTLKMLASAGFTTIELCSPYGYSDAGFGGLAKYSTAELRHILADAGLTCISSHFGLDALRKDPDAALQWAKDVGLTQVMVPSLDGPGKPTEDDVKRAADEFNKIAEKTAQAGLQQGLHNEGFLATTTTSGKRTYDLLFGLLDPKLVKFQFQVSEIADGFDAAEYFTRYPGRFISMHVQGWNADEKQIVAVGHDSLNWKKIFRAAKVGGIQNYFVEMAFPLMQASVPYLRKLSV